MAARDAIVADVTEYEKLGETVRALLAAAAAAPAGTPAEPLKAQVDLGCNIFCQAVVSVYARGRRPPGLGPNELTALFAAGTARTRSASWSPSAPGSFST